MSLLIQDMGTEILHLSERDGGIWTYSSNYTDGALRLFSVEELLKPHNSSIALLEWRNLDWTKPDMRKYAAISHVWTPSSEAARISASKNRPLAIDIDQDKPYTMCWYGLIQAATAASYLGCDYMWLDLLCLHQHSHTDKAMQIKNMGKIYKNASAVLVMPGGVAAVQSAERSASWITRAWTLQEATLCPNVYVLILSPVPKGAYLIGSQGSTTLKLEVVNDTLVVAPLYQLISARQNRAGLRIAWTDGGDATRMNIDVQCFGEDEAVIVALEGALCATRKDILPQGTDWQEATADKPGMNVKMLQTAAWRSMWLRTSTKPQDMVFSVMHLLDVDIEVDYQRSREDLIMEMAAKTSASPVWIDIGDKLPINGRSGLLPVLPPFHPNARPAYNIDDDLIPVAKLVNGPEYIGTFDIVLKTASDFDGHVICGQILKIRPISPNNETQFYVSNSTSTFRFSSYHGQMGSHVIVVGEMKAYNLSRYGMWSYPGSRVFIIKISSDGGWQKCGYGYLKGWLGPGKRRHIKLGLSNGGRIGVCNCEDRNSLFEVEAIVDKRVRDWYPDGKVQYLVRWKDSEPDRWYDEDQLNRCVHFIRQYETSRGNLNWQPSFPVPPEGQS